MVWLSGDHGCLDVSLVSATVSTRPLPAGPLTLSSYIARMRASRSVLFCPSRASKLIGCLLREVAIVNEYVRSQDPTVSTLRRLYAARVGSCERRREPRSGSP